jgi:hypothetical protein
MPAAIPVIAGEAALAVGAEAAAIAAAEAAALQAAQVAAAEAAKIAAAEAAATAAANKPLPPPLPNLATNQSILNAIGAGGGTHCVSVNWGSIWVELGQVWVQRHQPIRGL